jgi:hypothetical protein
VPIRDPATGKTVTDSRGKPGTTVALDWLDDPSDYTVDEVLAGEHKKDAPSKLERATDVPHELLADGPRPRAEVMAKAEEAGIGRATVENAWRDGPGRQSESAPGKSAIWNLSLPIRTPNADPLRLSGRRVCTDPPTTSSSYYLLR